MLFIATPLYENKVSSHYVHGLMQTANTLNRHNLSMQYAFEQGTYIAINREKLVRRFLKTNCQFFLFIDADTVFTAHNVMALLAADVEIVSGIYRCRMDVPKNKTKHSFRDLKGNPINTEENTCGQLQECSFMPTGMMLIRRNVFEQLYTKHEFIFDQGFRDSEYYRALCGDEQDDIFTRFEGEDIHFCKIWREMGGKLFIKTDVRIGHIGEREYTV